MNTNKNGLLDLLSKKKASSFTIPKPATPYTVGLNIIDNKTINGVGSINYTNQSVTNSDASSQEQ